MDSKEIREALDIAIEYLTVNWSGMTDERQLAIDSLHQIKSALSTIDPDADANAVTITRLVSDLQYIGGIIERGTGKPLDPQMPITKQVLKYVKKLEASEPEAIRRECEYKNILKALIDWNDHERSVPLTMIVEKARAAILSAEPAQDDGKAETDD